MVSFLILGWGPWASNLWPRGLLGLAFLRLTKFVGGRVLLPNKLWRLRMIYVWPRRTFSPRHSRLSYLYTYTVVVLVLVIVVLVVLVVLLVVVGIGRLCSKIEFVSKKSSWQKTTFCTILVTDTQHGKSWCLID